MRTGDDAARERGEEEARREVRIAGDAAADNVPMGRYRRNEATMVTRRQRGDDGVRIAVRIRTPVRIEVRMCTGEAATSDDLATTKLRVSDELATTSRRRRGRWRDDDAAKLLPRRCFLTLQRSSGCMTVPSESLQLPGQSPVPEPAGALTVQPSSLQTSLLLFI